MKKIFSTKIITKSFNQHPQNLLLKRHFSPELRPSVVLLRLISATIIFSGLAISCRKIEKKENEPYPKIKSQN